MRAVLVALLWSLTPLELKAYLDAIRPLLMDVLALVLGTVGTWVLAKQGTKTQSQAAASLLERIDRHCADAAAYVYQVRVKNAKDPSRPEVWDEEAKRSAREEAIEHVRRSAPQLVDEARRMGLNAELVIAQKIEKAVMGLGSSTDQAAKPRRQPKRQR